MTKATLRLLESNHAPLRTPEVVGAYPAAPEVGVGFYFYSVPLEPGAAMRIIRTSPVVQVHGRRFQTENSIYELELAE